MKVLLVILSLGFCLTISGAGTARATGEDTVKVGVVLSLSGLQARLAEQMKLGYDFAAATINKRGGVPVGNHRYRLELVYADDKSDPQQAAAAAEHLIDSGIDYLLGPFSSGLVEAVATVAEKHGVPLVQSGGSSLSLYLQQPRRFLFGIPSTTDQYLAEALSLAAESAARQGTAPTDLRIAVAYVDNPVGYEMRDAVVSRAAHFGMQIALDAPLPTPIEDLSGLLTKVAAAQPDVLMIFGYAQGAQVATRQLRDFRVNVPMILLTHCDGAQIERLSAADYIVCTSQWDAYTNYSDRWIGNAVNFQTNFEVEHGFAPASQAAQGAASVVVLANALQRAGDLASDAVRDALARTDMTTFFGPVRFDETGKNIAKPMIYMQVQGGRYKVVWPRDVAWTRMIYPMPRWEDR